MTNPTVQSLLECLTAQEAVVSVLRRENEELRRMIRRLTELLKGFAK